MRACVCSVSAVVCMCVCTCVHVLACFSVGEVNIARLQALVM